MECIEPTQPQGEKSSGSGGKLELVCCIFNLPVVSMEGQVNDHLVVAQYPGTHHPTPLRQMDQKLLEFRGIF